MKDNIMKKILLLILVLAFGVNIYAEEIIRVVCDNNYPPYSFVNGNNQLEGIVPDQWNLFSQVTGIRVELVGMNWAEAMKQFNEGKFDVIDTIFETEERKQSYLFTPSYAIISVPIFIYKTLS